MRPYLLAGGIALLWYADFQDIGVDGDPPAWGMAAVTALRLAADFVGAWLVISVLRLACRAACLGWYRLRARRQ